MKERVLGTRSGRRTQCGLLAGTVARLHWLALAMVARQGYTTAGEGRRGRAGDGGGDLTLILPFQLIYWVVYTPTV